MALKSEQLTLNRQVQSYVQFGAAIEQFRFDGSAVVQSSSHWNLYARGSLLDS